MVRDLHVDTGDARHVDDNDFRPVLADSSQELLGQLTSSSCIQGSDDREDEELVTHLQHWRRQLPDGYLLLADDTLSLVDEADANCDRNSVGSRLICIEHSI